MPIKSAQLTSPHRRGTPPLPPSPSPLPPSTVLLLPPHPSPRRPLPPPPPPLFRTALLAAFLCVVGLVFSVLGVVWVWTESVSDALPFLVLGGLSLIPGGFHAVLLYLAYTQSYGWTYDKIPSYERQ